MSARITTDVVADVLANVATAPPWRAIDENHARHVVDADGNVIALDVGDDAPMLAAAPDIAADLLDARASLAALAAAVRAEREAIVELDGADRALSDSLDVGARQYTDARQNARAAVKDALSALSAARTALDAALDDAAEVLS